MTLLIEPKMAILWFIGQGGCRAQEMCSKTNVVT